MKRVGGRWKHKDLAQNLSEWARNTKNGIKGMWRSRVEQLKIQVAELEHALDFVSQSGGGDMRAVIQGIGKQRKRVEEWTGMQFS